MNSTSTHDTKRSEDVRARIDVLSELDGSWLPRLHRWSKWNQPSRTVFNGRQAPDQNEECLLYQTLLGAWPFDPLEEPEFVERVVAFLQKALREAKVHTSWIHPDLEYEKAVEAFIRKSLRPKNESNFLESLRELKRGVAFYGHLNALSQTLLKITSPGVPDFYQGTELWDFSLVDPDNRRPVDFERRVRLLEELKSREAENQDELLKDLQMNWQDGRIKLFLIWKALNFRSAHKELFASGEYLPLEGAGKRREHLVAFARRRRKMWAIIAAPRLAAGLLRQQESIAPEDSWPDLKIILPRDYPARWRNVFTNGVVTSKPFLEEQSVVLLSSMLEKFPVVLLEPALK